MVYINQKALLRRGVADGWMFIFLKGLSHEMEGGGCVISIERSLRSSVFFGEFAELLANPNLVDRKETFTLRSFSQI